MSEISVITESILLSIKKMLGLDKDYDVFDPELIIHINSVFGTLHQLGVGPEEQFRISGDSETWSEFDTEGEQIDEVKTYVYLRVRLLFDPPSSSFVLSSFKEQLQELEWRLNVKADEIKGIEDEKK